MEQELPDRAVRAPAVPLGALFAAFTEISLSGFGGVLAWAHRSLVDRRRWLAEREFAEMLGLCQLLPGPNIGNLAICVGARFRGPLGALAALAGLLLPPLVVVVALGELYARGSDFAAVQAAVRGAGAVAVGLLLAAGLRMARPFRREPEALLMAALAFVAVGLLRWPLLPTLLVLAPCSIALAWRRLR